jgi:amino acid permease
MFTVCNEMRNITTTRVNAAINSAVGTGLVLYLILAGVGYSTFGSEVADNILTSYPGD